MCADKVADIPENPVGWNLVWTQRALIEEYRKQGIKPGERISVPVSKLYQYCPEEVLEFSRWLGKQDFQVVGASMDIAAQCGLIGMSWRTGRRRGNEYWLLPSHPTVRRARIAQKRDGNVITLVPAQPAR